MKKTIVLILSLSFLLSTIGAQEIDQQTQSVPQGVKSDSDIVALYQGAEYDEVISKYAANPKTLTTLQLEYLARTYYKQDYFNECVKYADSALKKNAKNASMLYLKGMAYNAQGKSKQAIPLFDKAIGIDSSEGEYSAALADSYLALEQLDNAMINYKKATYKGKPAERAYYMIAAILMDTQDEKNALSAFYEAKSKIKNDQDLYLTVLYNIASLEFINENYEGALVIYKELTNQIKNDYKSHEKTVMCYNILGKYSDAYKHKSELYRMYEEALLVDTDMANRLCVDLFKVDDYSIQAFEYYKIDEEEESHVKDEFYVQDADGKIMCRIEMQYQPNSKEYIFAKIEGNNTYYYDLSLVESTPYITIKDFVRDIIRGKIKPIAN